LALAARVCVKALHAASDHDGVLANRLQGDTLSR
jgi:hypothetical protein